MNLRNILSAVLFISIFIISENVFAQDDAAAKAMMEYITPGSMHTLLAKGVGEWRTKITMWLSPGAEPIVTEGTAESEMLLGGRYLQTKHTAVFNGMPLNGVGIDGYDNGKKVFISIWIDNFSTGVMVLEGKYNEELNTINFTGKTYDPIVGKEINIRQVVKLMPDGSQKSEMYNSYDGKEFKSMEIEMIRVR